MQNDTAYIQKTIEAHPVVLFMKGTPEHPHCGFSGGVVKLLKELHVPFHGIDVLDDAPLRADLKTFSQWPTFPQLYVNGVFIGGFDIVREMHLAGEFLPLMAPYVSATNT